MKKRFDKIYLEISNVCDLACSFCPGTRRPPRVMSPEEVSFLLPRLAPYTDELYFHLMGEPLCHPQLGELLALAGQAGFRVSLTTNGVSLPGKASLLLAAPALRKLNISLHALEANDIPLSFSQYVEGCCSACQLLRQRIPVIFRLWNGGVETNRNGEVLALLERHFPRPWAPQRYGFRLADRVFLHYENRFTWPDLSAPATEGRVFCRGLRDQLGILCDGTVVPCCLDHDGSIPLGNLFRQELEEVLSSPRTQTLARGLLDGSTQEPLCRRCGFAAARFGSPSQKA